LAALVAGSMAPDFSKILTLRPSNDWGHSWLGTVWFCVPAGLIVLTLFDALLKEPLFALAPRSHQQRLRPFLDRRWWNSATSIRQTILGLVLGAMTHLAWDSCTHQYGWTVLHAPFLDTILFETDAGALRLYKVLQHASTLLGFTLLIFWYRQWYRRAAIHEVVAQRALSMRTKRIWLLSLLLIGMSISAGYGLIKAGGISNLTTLKVFAGRSAVAALAVAAIEILLFGLIWRWRSRRNVPPPAA
jgi:hypothetical protein